MTDPAMHHHTEKRHLCSELVSMTCAGPGGWYAIAGNLEEIAETSALVLAENRVRPGTKVRIRCETNQLKGVVKSCVHDELGYQVKVRLDPDSRWSERWFTPQHLLTLTGKIRHQVFPLKIASGY